MLAPPPTTTTTAMMVAPSAMEDTATEEILSYDVTEETFTPHDVVLGKGNGINCLPGNVKFRQIIAKYKPLYNSTPRSLKGGVAELVINEVACMDPPGRFLEATADKRFKQVARKRAIEKTCQALREKKTGIKLSATAAVAPSSSSVSSSNGRGKTSPANSTTSGVVGRASPPLPLPPQPSPPVTPASAVPAVVVMVPSIQVHKAPRPPLSPPTLVTAAATRNSQPSPATTTNSGPRRVDDMEETPMPQKQQDMNNSNATASADTPSSDPEAQEQQKQQQPVWPIRENDVLYGGRGRKHFHRLANQRFLELVKYRRNDYHESSSKKNVALLILEEWKNQTPPGRFLQQDAKSEEWFEISTAKIQEKTCQALRDLKRERGPGGVRPTIADRMVDPSNRSSNSNHQGTCSSSSNSSSGDEGNNNLGNKGSRNSLPEHVHSQQTHHHLESHVHQLPPQHQQQHQQQHGHPPLHHNHHHQPQHQHSAHQPYHHNHQQYQQQQQFAPHPQGPPPQHYPQHSQQPIYSNPPPPQQQQQRHHHHALPPMQDPPVSPLSPHDHVYLSQPPMPAHGALLPLSTQGPTSPSHQHPSMNHPPPHFSPLHTPPGQNGWFQDPNSPVYSPHNAPHNSRVMMHESYSPPMGHVHHQHPHHSQYPHSMAPAAPSAPATYHLAARPSPPPPPPTYYPRNHSYSHGADTTSVPPPPPLPRNADQDPQAAAIHRQAHIVAQEMRKMDEMMRRASPGCGPPPPPPPPTAHHSQPVPRTVVATTTAPLSPPLPPSNHRGQVPIWHGHDQTEMMRHASGVTMSETRYGEVAVNPTPHYHYSPQTSAASHGRSGSYHDAMQHHQQQQQQLSPVTNSVISTSSAADGSSSISISSSGDLSHGALIPTKEETMKMRQVTMNSSTFAPIQSEDDGSSKAYRGDDHAAVPQVNALARVVVQSVPVSPPRGQRNDMHSKMMMPIKKKVDTSSPLRKGSNASCPGVKANKSLPIKTKPTKKPRASSSPKKRACSTPSPTKKPTVTNKSGKESPLQGELEAASLLANMFAV